MWGKQENKKGAASVDSYPKRTANDNIKQIQGLLENNAAAIHGYKIHIVACVAICKTLQNQLQ